MAGRILTSGDKMDLLGDGSTSRAERPIPSGSSFSNNIVLLGSSLPLHERFGIISGKMLGIIFTKSAESSQKRPARGKW